MAPGLVATLVLGSPSANYSQADFATSKSSWCKGENSHKLTKHSLSSCLSACRKAHCACFAYRETSSTLPRDNCKYVTDQDFRGTSKSKTGFTAFVRRGMVEAQGNAGGATSSSCRVDGLSLLPSTERLRSAPSFYLHDPSAIVDERLLARCFAQRAGRAWNSSSDVAHWAREALASHPARVSTHEKAEFFVVMPFAALSTAAGTCNGRSHFDRMLSLAQTLKPQLAVGARPGESVLVFNGVESVSKNPLGELGKLLSIRGGRAACLSAKHCGSFSDPGRMLPLPWLSLPALQTRAVRTLVEGEACGQAAAGGSGARGSGARGGDRGGPRREVQLFFRGSLGSSREAQDLRIRLPQLRQISGAQISLVDPDLGSGGATSPAGSVGAVGGETGGSKGGGKADRLLLPSAAQYAAKNRLSVSGRLKRMDGRAYAERMLGAKFCLAPAGDVGSSPGSRLYDALAAGCVPILVGVERASLPLSRQIDYGKVAGFISRTSFMRDPVYACEGLMHRLEPLLPAMRRAMADARRRLLYGVTDDGGGGGGGGGEGGGDGLGGSFLLPMLLRENYLVLKSAELIPELNATMGA
jgi:hypothetical protein